jgi:tetratricopeptide (TPR) repeat protein
MEAVTREIEALKALLQDEPDDLAARIRLANIYFDAGMFEGALEHYQRAVELEPGDINVLTDLGTSYRNLGRPEEALARFEEAVRIAPDHWRGWFNIGIVSLYDTGDFDRARTAFDKVAALKPGTVDMNALQEEIDRVRAEKTAGGGAE